MEAFTEERIEIGQRLNDPDAKLDKKTRMHLRRRLWFIEGFIDYDFDPTLLRRECQKAENLGLVPEGYL